VTVGLLDWIFLCLILLVVVKVTLTGFVTEFFSKAAVIIGTLGAVLLYRRLSPHVVRLIGTDGFPDVIAFLVIFLVLYLAVKFLQQLAGSAMQGESLTNLDRAMGFFLGLAESFLLLVVILIIMKKQVWIDTSLLTEPSLFARLLEPFAADAPLKLPDLFR